MPTYEEIADLLEKLDIPRGPAQISARLLASDPPALSFGELQATLGMSKAAISVALRYLEALEAVRYTRVSGTRRRLIHFDPQVLVRYLRRRMAIFRAFAASLQALANDHGDTQHAWEVRRLADLCHELDVAVTTILTTWEEEAHEQLRRDPETATLSHPLQE